MCSPAKNEGNQLERGGPVSKKRLLELMSSSSKTVKPRTEITKEETCKLAMQQSDTDIPTNSQLLAQSVERGQQAVASAIKESLSEFGTLSRLDSWVASGIITKEEAREIIFKSKSGSIN